jgi:hypothetical protein
MDIKIVNEHGLVTPPIAPAPMQSSALDGGLMDGYLERSIGSVLGLETSSELSVNKAKINTLLNYAKSQTEDHSPENLKWVIRSLELKLGTPPFAEKRVNWLSRYAYLLTEEKKIQKEKEAFERV